MISPIPGIYKSLVRATTDMIEALNASGLYTPIAYHNWEERGPESELPRQNLIGIDGFSFDENDGLWMIRYALALSSYNDTNLLNEIELLGDIHERLREGSKVNLYNVDTGLVVSELYVATFRLLPMSQSEIRNYRTMGLELTRTGR